MKLSDMFPRRYASGGDLDGKPVTLTIARVTTERMRPSPQAPDADRYVIYFQDAQKGVVLCETLATQIDEAVDGNRDTNNWTGKKVTIFPVPMTVAGRNRIAIRARRPVATNGRTPPKNLTTDNDGEITA